MMDCKKCGFYDHDYGGCSCPSGDRWYACPIENKKLENQKALAELSMAGDAISRQAVLDALYALCDTGETLIENPWRDNPHIDALIDAIEDLPSVKQERTGHWRAVYQGDEIINYRCSECEFGNTFGKSTYRMNYCPNCGCRMIEQKESEE